MCCEKCGYYNDCNKEQEHKKRGAKIKYNDDIHRAWRLSSRDRYNKMKIKEKEVEK